MKIEGFKNHSFTTSDRFNIAYGHNFDSTVDESKPCLVFNYGLVCNLAHWKFQIPYFHELGYPILYHDYRFHFDSSSSQSISDLTFSRIVNDIHELLHFLQIEKSVMIGHSMGVNTTLEYALHYPEDLLGSILISGTVLPPQDIMFDSNMMDHLQPILEILLKKYPKLFNSIWKTGHLNPIAKVGIHRGGFNTQKVPMDFVEYYLKKIGELKPEVFFQLLRQMKEQNITRNLENINTKTLVMGGDLDQVIPNYLQQILTNHLPNNEYYTVKNGSHVPQADFPETVNERILIFLDEL